VYVHAAQRASSCTLEPVQGGGLLSFLVAETAEAYRIDASNNLICCTVYAVVI